MEELIQLLNKLGIPFNVISFAEEGEVSISIGEGEGFLQFFTFTSTGKFVSYSIYNERRENQMTQRQEVFEALVSERDYQKKRWGFRQPDGTFIEAKHDVGQYMTYMRYYMRKAEEALTTSVSDEEALAELRKVVALGVACFEEHGIEGRDPIARVTNARD